MNESTSNDNLDRLCIVGIILNAESEQPEIYGLMIETETDDMVTDQGDLLFVTDIKGIESIFSFANDEIRARFELPTEATETVDLALALYLLQNEDADQNAEILDSLNLIFDLMRAINAEIPAERKKTLYGLADFLTFDNDLAGYLERSGVSRHEVIDHIIWCCGMLMTHSRILSGIVKD